MTPHEIAQIISAALTIVSLALLPFLIAGAYKAHRDHRKNMRRLDSIRAEMDFLQSQYDIKFEEANQAILKNDREAYENARLQIQNLDLRWEREVTARLNNPPQQ
jgi:hypothetical protein